MFSARPKCLVFLDLMKPTRGPQDARWYLDQSLARCRQRKAQKGRRDVAVETLDKKRKSPRIGSEGFWTCFAIGPQRSRGLYALVSSESTPLASEPMLLPSAR